MANALDGDVKKTIDNAFPSIRKVMIVIRKIPKELRARNVDSAYKTSYSTGGSRKRIGKSV
jgi:hypothetical protein